MNFRVAISILKMKKATFSAYYVYYFNKDKSAMETQKKIRAVNEKGAVTDRTCRSIL